MTIDLFTTVLLAIVALVAGTVDAVAGGGGLICLPALTLAGLPLDLALATNKGQSTFGSLASSAAFWRAGKVDRKQARYAFPIAFVGSVLGALLQMAIPQASLRPIVMVLLLVAAGVLVMKKPAREEDSGGGKPWIAAALAFGIGGYDGFFGPGTGTFLVVGFVALCGRSVMRATADAKIVNFAANLAALLTFARAGTVLWAISLPMAVGQLIGGVIGARLALRGGAKFVRLAVVAITIALVARLAYQMWAP